MAHHTQPDRPEPQPSKHNHCKTGYDCHIAYITTRAFAWQFAKLRLIMVLYFVDHAISRDVSLRFDSMITMTTSSAIEVGV